MTKYLLINQGNLEACYIDNTITEVKSSLTDFFRTAYGEPVLDNDPNLENDFEYVSQSKFNSISDMTLEQLQKEFDKFNWLVIPFDNKEELIEKLINELEEDVSREDIVENVEEAFEEELEYYGHN